MLQSNKPIGRLGEALLSGNSVVVAELAFAKVIEARGTSDTSRLNMNFI